MSTLALPNVEFPDATGIDRSYHQGLCNKFSKVSSSHQLRSRGIGILLGMTMTATPVLGKTCEEVRNLQTLNSPPALSSSSTSLDSDLLLNYKRRRIASLRIGRLSELAEGWDGADALAPNSIASENAETILSIIGSLHHEVSVLPMADGGISLFLDCNAFYASIDCFNDGDILCATKVEEEPSDVWQTTLEDVQESVDRIAEFLESRASLQAAQSRW